MYPLKFNNIYFDKIWGGRDLELFRDNLPEGKIGESWDVACHNNGESIVQNGKYKGMKISELIELKGEELIGKKIDKEWFPLLVKLINAKDKLSVQVHPEDEYAKKFEGEMGKTECWYVVEAFEGANLIVGTKNCTKEQFREAALKGELDQYLNKIPVNKGDFFFIKSGLVHAIGEGVVIAEIQQNSDITYRVYDYNRGREIHVDKAIEVIDLDLKGEKIEGKIIKCEGFTKTSYCSCEHFTIELYDINEKMKDRSDENRFYILTCVDGKGELLYKEDDKSNTIEIKTGDSIMIPASLGEYEIQGNLKVIKSFK